MKRLTIFGMLAVLLASFFVSFINVQPAYALSESEYRTKQVLGFFMQCLEDHTRTSSSVTNFEDLWEEVDNENIIVGLDLDTANGAWSCRTLTHAGMKRLDSNLSGATDATIENRFCREILNLEDDQYCRDGDTGMSGDDKQDEINAMISAARELRDEIDEPTHVQKAEPVYPFMSFCFTYDIEASSGEDSDLDFTFEAQDGSTVYATHREGVGASEINAEGLYELGSIANNGAIGDIKLGFDYGGSGGDITGGDFHIDGSADDASDFIPLGRDYDLDDRKDDSIADCPWIRDNADWLYADIVSLDENGSLVTDSSGTIDNNSQDLDNGENPPTCESESGSSFGWLICPVIEHSQAFLKWVMTGGIMGQLLNFNLGEQGIENLQKIWSGFRTIANLLFIISFFVVIYSAATGSIMSAYDIRKLLPRLFIVAILVQLSFFLSLLALSITNDVGAGVRSLMLFPVRDSLTVEVSSPFGNTTDFGITKDFTEVLSEAGSDIADAVIGGAAGIVLLIVMLLLIFYSIGGIILLGGVFIIRDIGIVALIVLSPLAFTSAVLPGTENYLRTWWKWFFGLLAMYPIMIVFMSSGQLVASIWTESDAFNSFVSMILATICLFLPFFFAPKVLKFAGQAAGALTGVFNTFNEKKDKFKQSSGYQRSKLRAKGAAWDKANPAVTKLGQGGKIRQSLGRTAQLSSARASEGLRKLEEEQKSAATILSEGQTAKIRSDAVAAGLDPDDAVVDHLDKILNDKDGKYTSGQRLAAGKVLASKYSTNQGAIQSLRHAIEGRVTGATKADQEFAQKVLDDNYSTVGKDAAHTYKGAGADGVHGALGVDTEAVIGYKKSAIKDMLSDDAHSKRSVTNPATGKDEFRALSDAERVASQREAATALAQKYIDAAANDNLKGHISAANAKEVITQLDRFGIDRSSFDTYFDPSGRVK